MLTIHLLRSDGSPEPRSVLYDPEAMRMTWDNGEALPTAALRETWGPDPRGEGDEFSVRIVLGRACNFRCAYCHQAAGRYADYVASPSESALKALAGQLGRLVRGKKTGFQFWGGEPMRYFREMRLLMPLLAEASPDCSFSMITNGSLFTEDNVAFLLKVNEANPLYIGVSHDGPGQGLRGGDPLADAASLALIEKVKNGVAGFSFNPVITAANSDFKALADYFAARFEGVALGEGSPLTVCGGVGADCVVPEAQLAAHARHFYHYLLTTPPERMPYHLYLRKIHDFINLLDSNEATPRGGCCVACSDKTVTVDLAGNVLTCQSQYPDSLTSGGESHRLGHISQDAAEWKRPAPVSWEHKENCRDCPVLAFCRGACPFPASEDDEAHTCRQYFFHYLPMLAFVTTQLTGRLFAGVDRCAQGATDSIIPHQARYYEHSQRHY